MPIRRRGDHTTATRSRWSGWRTFAFAYAVIFVLSAAWSLATPPFAAPDEPVQVIKAVAVAHGEFVGRSATHTISPHIVVQVPASFVSGVHLPTCFVQHRNLSPACEPPLTNVTDALRVSIYVGRYPPLYYAIVGVPSWFSDSMGAVYAMRLVSVALCTLFLALATTAVMLWSRRRLALAGLLVAMTPQVLFLSGVVNPNALEIAAAICLWTSAALLATGEGAPPAALVAITTAAAATELLCRALSPLWVAITLLVALGLAGRRRIGELVRSTAVRWGGLVVIVATVLAAAWTIHFHAGEVQTVTGAAAHAIKVPYARALLDRQKLYLHETIGDFGVLNVPSPGLTYLLYEIAAGLLIVGALIWSRMAGRITYVVTVIAAVAVPFGIVLSQASTHHGLIWQGRDGAPLTLAIPLVAGALLGSRRAPRGLDRSVAIVASVLVGVGSIGAFAGALNRYVVGFDHPFAFFAGAEWQPPLGAVTLLVLAAVATVAGIGASLMALGRE